MALPEKTLSDVLCPLSDCQRAVFEVGVRVRRRLSSYLQHCGQTEEPQQRLQQILAIDTHPLLCSAVHELACGPLATVMYSLPLAARTQLDSFACSGKLTVLKLLLEKALRVGDFADDVPTRSAEKVVVFSQKPQVLELVAQQVLSRYEGLRYAALKSAMTSEQRMAAVRSFQEDEGVALLLATTGISAYGYTLTAAQTVVLVDHNFNPFVDLQAIDRCHRIGQTRAVSVYRLVSEEENESRLMKWRKEGGVMRSLTRFKEYVASTVIKTDKTDRTDKRSVLSEIQADREQTKRTKVEEPARVAAERKEPFMTDALDSDSGSSGFELYD